MTTQTTESPLPWLRVSYSSLNTFEWCARKFEFQKIYGQGKERVDEESIPGAVGKAFHAGYQAFIESRNLDLACWELLRAYPWALDMYESNNRRSWDVALSTFMAACETIQQTDYELMYFDHPQKGKIPCVELPFELRFVNTAVPGFAGIAVIGYIDLVMHSRYSGKVRTTDIKTHMDWSKDRTAEYKYNAQQVPYGIIVEHLMGQRIESFEVNYLDCFLSLTEPRISEYLYIKDQVALQEWLTRKVLQFRQIKTMLELDLFPRRENGCVAYRYPCKFMDICSSRSRDNIGAWFGALKDVDDSWDPWITAEIDLQVEI